MMKLLFKLFAVAIVLLVIAPSTSFAANDSVVQKEQKQVVRDKVWKVTLNRGVDATTVTKNNVFVLDSAGNRVDVSLLYSAEEGVIKVNPPKDNYKANSAYTLVLTDRVKDLKGKRLKASTMKFTTSSQLSKDEVFVENKENIVELNDAITVVESLGETLVSFSETAVTIANPSAAIANAKKGDILALPPTVDYPFGFAIKVVSAAKNGNIVTLRVQQPTAEEVINSVDIAATVPMSSLLNLQDVEGQELVAATNHVALDSRKTIDFQAIYNDLNKDEVEGFKVVLNNYEFIDKAVLSGEMGFTGSLSTAKNDEMTKFIVDMKVFSESKLALNALQVPNGVKKRYPLVDGGLKFRIKQTANLVGVLIDPALVLELKGHIGTQIDVKTESKLSVSATVPEGKGDVVGDVDIPTTDASMSISSVNAEGSATASLEVPFTLLALQFNLATLGVESGVKAEFKGYLEGTVKFGGIETLIPEFSNNAGYCVDSSVTFFANPYFTLGRDADDKNNKYTFLKLEKDLFAFSACQLDRLAVADNIEVAAHSPISFPVTGIELEGNKKPFDLYDETISLQTSDKIVKVDRVNFNLLNFFNDSFDYELSNVKVGEQVKTKVIYQDSFRNSPIEQNVTLTARGNVRGQVVTEANKAIPNATVGLYKQVNLKDQVLVEEVKTDAQGRFEFIAPDALYVLKVKHAGYKEKLHPLTTLLNTTNEKLTLTKEEVATYKFLTLEKFDKQNKTHKYIQLSAKTLDVKALNQQLKKPAQTMLSWERDLIALNKEFGTTGFYSVAKSTVTYEKNNLLGVRIETGNDFASPAVNAFLIDLKSAKRYTVSDVFKTQSQRDQLVALVKQKLRDLGEPKKNVVYREDRLKFDTNWGIYANDKGYVIVLPHDNHVSDANIFDVYEIVVPFTTGVAPAAL